MYIPPNDGGKPEGPTQHEADMMRFFDVNAIPPSERAEIVRCKAGCLDLFSWFRSCFRVMKQGSEGPQDVISTYLVQLARSIIRYKRIAEKNKILGMRGCTTDYLEYQISAAMEIDKETWNLWNSRETGWLDAGLPDETILNMPRDSSSGWHHENFYLQDAKDYTVFRSAGSYDPVIFFIQSADSQFDMVYQSARKRRNNVEARVTCTMLEVERESN